MRRILWLCALVVPLGFSFAQGSNPKAAPKAGEARPPSGPDYSAQTVRATGAGAPDVKASSPAQARLGAERAALLDAFRNLLAQVKGVSVDGTRKMGDLMEKDEVRAKVEGVVKGYKIANKRYFSDNGVEIDIEVPLAALSDVVDPDATPVEVIGKKEAEKSNTGLVIDARGLKVTPALAPRVLDGEGKALYSIDTLSKDARKTTGVASYVQSLEEAQKSMKAGDKPLVIKAAKAAGADLQLAAEDAKKLAAINLGFLAEGKVVIVLN